LEPFHVSVKGEYALLALFDLATRKQDGPTKISAIAQRQRIPQKFLELILATLKQGGFVESRRGAEGGYMLAREAENIKVGDVLRYLDGRGAKPRRDKQDSPFSDLWTRSERAVSEVLDQVSLADTVRAWRERHSRYVPNWDI
jgi:Rrf2 family protein